MSPLWVFLLSAFWREEGVKNLSKARVRECLAGGPIWRILAVMIKEPMRKRYKGATAVFLLCVCQSLSAQFGGLLFEYQADDPRYLAEDAASTNSEFLTLLNEQGGAGKLRLGPRILGSSDGSMQDDIELFGCDLDNRKTYQFRLVTFVDRENANAFISEVNSQGGQGYEYAGNFLLGDDASASGQEEVMIFSKESGSAQTFEYKLILSSFGQLPIATYNAEGANGWEWTSPIFFGQDLYDFYVRRPGQNETFSYLSEVAAQSRSAFVAQLDAQGSEGQRWKGTFTSFDGSSFQNFAVFVQNSQESFTYDYDSLPQQFSRSAYINQLNAQGEAGFYYNSELVFQDNNTNDFQVIYTTRTGRGGGTLLAGIIIIRNDDEVGFTPEESGDFRLYQSTDLRDFSPVGASQFSSGGTLTWSIDSTSEPSRFFRVQRE